MKTFLQILTVMILICIIAILGFSLYQKSSQSVDATVPTQKTPLTQSSQSSSKSPSSGNFNGIVTFAVDYKVEYAEGTLGLTFIENIQIGSYKPGLFGAKTAQIEVLDSSGKIIGLYNADQKGNFDFKVKDDDFYQLNITYKNTVKHQTVRSSETRGMKIYLGYFNAATGQWEN